MFFLRRSTLRLAPNVRSFAGVNLSKIVATIGPVSEDAVTLPKIVQNGMSVMRVNFSHATEEEVELRLKSLSGSADYFPLDAKDHKLRAVLLDTKGAPWRIRSRNFSSFNGRSASESYHFLHPPFPRSKFQEDGTRAACAKSTIYLTIERLAVLIQISNLPNFMPFASLFVHGLHQLRPRNSHGKLTSRARHGRQESQNRAAHWPNHYADL